MADRVPAPAARISAADLPGTAHPRTLESVELRRRQLSHDIRHELGTIMALASALYHTHGADEQCRVRARQILHEARYLDELYGAYEQLQDEEAPQPAAPLPIRLDLVISEVVAAVAMATGTDITFSTRETWGYADPLGYRRALRNIIGNATEAAGADGTVHVAVAPENGRAVAQVEDDGPGFVDTASGAGSLGLGIVQELVVEWNAELEIRRGSLGGTCVRLLLPAPDGPGAGP